MSFILRLRRWPIVLGAASIVGCAEGQREGDESQEAPAAQAETASVDIAIRFKAMVGDEAFACGRFYEHQGASKTRATPQDFRFFVENVRLISESGREVKVALDTRSPYQTTDLALIDFTNQEGHCTSGGAGTNLVVTGKVPAGRYRGIAFSNGVPAHLNHADPSVAPAPLQAPGASWNWLLGYRFVMAEIVTAAPGAVDAGVVHGGEPMPMDMGTHAPPPADSGHMPMPSTPGIAMAHVGSTACSGNPARGFTCAKQNRNEIRLADFDPTSQVIIADFGALFRHSDLKAGAECHSGGELCTPMFQALGIDFATGKPLATQSMFRVE